MKKVYLLLFGFLFFYKAVAQDFTVNKSHIEIFIHEEGYFDVVENYDLTFEIHKHGIYRDIQTKYNLLTAEGTQEKRKIKIKNVEVPNYKFDVDFDFEQQLSDRLNIKIGDKNISLIGPQHYQIKYRVYNAFLFDDSKVQFYWNVKPDGWNTVFQQLDFTIHLPENIATNLNNIFVYSGDTGTTKNNNEFEITYSNGVYTAKSTTNFKSAFGQSVTVLLNLPPNSITEIKPLWPFWTNYGWTLLIGLFLAAFYWVWNKFGKDDEVVAAISYFPPSGVDPAMAGFLINDRGDTQDLISLIPHWGSRGIIKMEYIAKDGFFSKEDTKLISLKALPVDAPEYEKKIFKGLFGSFHKEGSNEVLISSLKNTFYTTMFEAKKVLKEKAQIYYVEAARKMQTKVIVAILIITILSFFIFLNIWGLLAALSVIPVAIFLLIMSFYLVKKNAIGNTLFSELKGFKQFIKVAEENKLKMLLKDNPTYFESTMGYALAFGMFNSWSKKFEDLNLQPPSWYSSSSGVVNMHNFTNSFSNSINTAKSAMVSTPSSSSSGGGGSSGGGFGGGGGGSW
ncbi:DUF2207 domain-containing protein [Lutibacter sp. A80]|uniref:DUF2207 domain-containing protein n=1 Tax=Lutibacter sp. A80 TaxID=2918453 RepID=UPI001F05AD28|nr:DUF2207 domain-containing protein [Lutibacter sp. A80]UMB62178.1 DUF2207 domain-containing protein [Lutibacter sp. A80]